MISQHSASVCVYFLDSKQSVVHTDITVCVNAFMRRRSTLYGAVHYSVRRSKKAKLLSLQKLLLEAIDSLFL